MNSFKSREIGRYLYEKGNKIMDFKSKIERIERLFETGEYTIVAKESVSLVEQALRQLFREQLTRLNEQDRLRVQEVERKMGGGKKGVERFTMGRLVQLFQTSQFLNA
ncbi:MAG: hypothetical protein GY797_03215 [Deltaproteobacteria bacterium]|nr:hypothetical protein [Deltaproteobacteria bacterium]